MAKLRKFGLDFVGDIAWGTHLCQFYETKEDLADILVPYFAAGLRNNEFCMWITSEPLQVKEAKAALKKKVPNLEQYLAKGQIEIIPYSEWYTVGGSFNSDCVLRGWVDKEKYALSHGFDGLRLTGNTFWVERSDWKGFADYEAAVNDVIGQHKMIALCTYSLLRCSGTDVVDVVRNHVGTLIKMSGKWGVVENKRIRKETETALRESENKYKSLFTHMTDGFAYHEVLFDKQGKPVDYVFLEVNDAFRKLTGLKEDIIGKKVTEVLPGIEHAAFDWIGTYGKVAATGKPAKFDSYFELLKKWYSVSAYSPAKGYFVATFEDITERKQIQEKLEQYTKSLEEHVEERTKKLGSASLYARSLIEASMDPLVTISAEGRITDVNRATELVTGYPREQLIGSDFSDYFTEPEKARSGYQQVFTQGFVKDYPLAIRHKSGKVTYVLYNATVYKNALGEIQGVFAAARDVTERKQAEDMLRAASLYARSLIEASLDPLVTISAEGKITDVNKSTEDVTGFSRDQLIGSDFSNYFTNPEEARKGYLKVFTEGFVRDYPLAIRHKSGRVTDVLYNATVFRNETGDIQGIFAAARDVTERKQAEEQIREQAELIDNAHDAITVRDLDNRIIYWNKGAERLYGWTAEEIIGTKGDEIFYREETPESIEARRKVHEIGEWTGELHQKTKKDKEIIVDGHWTLMRDPDGNPKSILAINTDVTERKSLESQMLRAQRMESIGTLASGIAHDLNNILTPIMLSLQLLQSEARDEETKKTIEVLEKSAIRGADLVRQVLTFARGVEGERKPIQLKHIIGEVAKIMEETFPKSIEIRVNVPSELETISGDATQLHQVMMNLCLNARDAMQTGGLLNVSAENVFVDEAYARMHVDAKVGKYLVVSVSDNGIGIPVAVRDKIFEPFFTTKERGKGTGLGLSTAMAIVKSHHGFINLYSEVGKGSTFKVYLPAAKSQCEKAEPIVRERIKGQGELVLLVEDELPICQITRNILETNGYKVLIANDGAEAMGIYTENRNKIRVVLMDMAMPVMDGYMTIRALRKVNPKVKIIAASGLTENGKLANISGYVEAFLAKPYTSERLLKTIDDVLKA